ncbi:MAG: hypothetical protein RLZZ200_2548 [Pseudomonadota bacterium]|jgi:hypothetical protein
MSDTTNATLNTAARRSSSVWPVSQALLTLTDENGHSAFDRTRDLCIYWVAQRAGRPLPPPAWRGESFELEEVGAQRVAAVGMDSPRYWSARLDDADKSLPQRTWVAEVGLGQEASGLILFGARLTCVTRGAEQPFQRSIPAFVRRIAEHCAAHLDERRLQKHPWLVDSEADVDRLVQLLTKSQRTATVIVASLPEGSSDPTEAVIATDELHRRTFGAAHVVVLSGDASFHLSDRIGREFSVFRQGVRSYLRGFDPDNDEPYRHPLGLPERILQWAESGPTGYVDMLVDHALRASVSRQDREHVLPPFAEVRRKAARQAMDAARKAGSSDRQLLELALEEGHQLRQDLEQVRRESNELLTTADAEREAAQQEARQARFRVDVLRRQNETLEARLVAAGQATAPTLIPHNLDDFGEWCDTHLAGHVEVLNRARKGVKSSQYEDDSFLYRALLLLRDQYVTMRRQPSAEARQAYETALQDLGLEESGTISQERLGEQGEEYYATFGSSRRVLDRHLKRGVSKDQRKCFRLYFFWDEDTAQAIVGWMPSHLDTRQT